MPQAATVAAHTSAKENPSGDQQRSSPQVILTGIIKLLEGQRRFAEEFGLPYPRVFHQDCLVFRQSDPATILRQWLQDKLEGPDKFQRLIDDLVEHNLALYAALDGVAQESIHQLSPAVVKTKGFSIFGWRPFPWLTYRRLQRRFQDNVYLRHQELVVRGFAKAYSRQRDSFRSQKHTTCIVSNKPQPKDSP